MLNAGKDIIEALAKGAKTIGPDVVAGAKRLKKEDGVAFLTAVNRATDVLPKETQQLLMSRILRVKMVATKYTEDVPLFANKYDALAKEEKLKILDSISIHGANSDVAQQTMDTLLGEGAGKKWIDISQNIFKDNLSGTRMNTNVRFIPGAKEAVIPGVKKLNEKGKFNLKAIKTQHLGEDGYTKGITSLLAGNKNYNLFRAQVRNASKQLNRYSVLGFAPKPLLDGDTAKALSWADKSTLDAMPEGLEIPGRSDLGRQLQDMMASEDTPLPVKNEVQKMYNYLAGTQAPDNIVDTVNKALIYSSLTNNLGTAIRSIFDPLKSTADMKSLMEALTDANVGGPAAKKMLEGMGGSVAQKPTELGHSMFKELIPDFAQGFEAKQKGYIIYANAISKAKELDPSGELGILPRMMAVLQGQEVDNFAKVDELVLESLTHGLTETNRVASKVSPIYQRPIFKGGLQYLALSETGINDVQQVGRALVGSFKGDPESLKRLAAYGRTAAIKTALFGLPALVAADGIDFVQDRLPEDQQAGFQNARNTLSDIGLLSTPMSMLGMDSSRLVQPAIETNPLNLFSTVPFIDDVNNLIGEGKARSKQGQTTAVGTSGVRLTALAARLLAPANPITQVVSAVNAAAVSRLGYQGLRTFGMAPDSTGPGTYEVHGLGEKTQNPVDILNAILSTNRDYRDKKTIRLNKVGT